MSKRAAIYIRVSTERQGEKVSPEAQEADGKAYCESKGYAIIALYRDAEKYRAGKRLIEPSGTRADRPAFKQMIADARAGKFDVIIAWREDRLYRSSRPMLDVCDMLDETKVDVELVKETFDKRIAPVKAWAAKMELDARKDRTAMGMQARFAKGKVWTQGVPYGYRKGEDGLGEVNPDEAQWVKAIWEWRAESKPLSEIRALLIEGGALQRRRELCKHPWEITKIQRLLRNPVYYTGVQAVSWDGNSFEIQYPILVDAEIAQQVIDMRERENAHPARHLKHDYLGMGLVYCAACDRKMASLTSRAFRRAGQPRNSMVRVYRCRNYVNGNRDDGCVRSISVKKLDAELWRKVSMILNNDADFEDRVQSRVEELRRDEGDAEEVIERLRRELMRVVDERQWVITQARKKSITDVDMERQLAVLVGQEKELKRELADKSLLIGNRAERLLEFANQYRASLRAKLNWLDREPRTPEEEEKQYSARRKIVEAIVTRVNVSADKTVRVIFEFDFAWASKTNDRQDS